MAFPSVPKMPSTDPLSKPRLLSQHYQQLAVLLTLYFAQGLPAGFITQALPAILRQYQVSRVEIGWSGLVLIPWGIKFLWSPWVDKHYSARLGRSRSWILPSQVIAIMILCGVAFFNPLQLTNTSAVLVLYVGLFALSLIGATQDVATDGLATRLLKPQVSKKEQTATPSPDTHRQNQGNAMQVIGYRGGLIVGGGVLLMLMDKLGWQTSFLLMAMLVGLLSIPIWLFNEVKNSPSVTVEATQLHTPLSVTVSESGNLSVNMRLKNYLAQHYAYFVTTPELRAWVGVLLTYKVAEGLASAMVKPMMVDLGASLSEIGIWVSIIGSGASLLGAGLATAWMKHMSRRTTIVLATLLQVLGIGAYGLIAYALQSHLLTSLHWLYGVNALEHLFAAFALVAVLTNIMHYARHEQAGSDFTVQVCLMSVLSGGSHFISGYLVEWLGYPLYYASCMLMGCCLFLPIYYWYRRANTVENGGQ